MSQNSAVYTHGHHGSVLRSHSWRTATNSCAYLLPLLKPDMVILDVGCGPGTISVDLARFVPQGRVVGLEATPDPLNQGRAFAQEKGITNVEWVVGDAHKLAFPDNTFDVVHAHAVTQHLGDPVQAFREMLRVTKPGGIIANRETDLAAMTWYPEVEGMREWHEMFIRASRANGGEPNAGRRLHVWAKEAGIDPTCITKTVSGWCYSTPEERAWWSNLWAERTLKSDFARLAREKGTATDEELERAAEAWRKWGAEEDGWFGIFHGEIICRV
ncbi:UbiE family methyltransferase [Heliocybe sulcata]|uniref:UbiE family methyltransferase n=1 Tax=Heliocybe sulcata TaxID=5364 RepID=A0A5C3NCZ3_9AGAM|nr:UbiE family methyltransferase [Heliocybe sulcata]